MRRRYLSHAIAAASVLATAAVAACGFWIAPDRAYRWFLLGGFLPALWAYVEFAQVRGDDAEVGNAIMTFHRYTIAFAGFMLSTQIGLRLIVHAELLDPSWLSTGQRFRGLMLGAGMVVFGNFLPTLRSPWPFRQQPFAWQQSSSVRWRDLCTGRAWRRDILSLVLLPTVPIGVPGARPG